MTQAHIFTGRETICSDRQVWYVAENSGEFSWQLYDAIGFPVAADPTEPSGKYGDGHNIRVGDKRKVRFLMFLAQKVLREKNVNTTGFTIEGQGEEVFTW